MCHTAKPSHHCNLHAKIYTYLLYFNQFSNHLEFLKITKLPPLPHFFFFFFIVFIKTSTKFILEGKTETRLFRMGIRETHVLQPACEYFWHIREFHRHVSHLLKTASTYFSLGFFASICMCLCTGQAVLAFQSNPCLGTFPVPYLTRCSVFQAGR